MALVSSLIDQAYNRSLKARPAQFDEPFELRAVVRRSQMEMFLAAAAVDPKFIGKRADVAKVGDAWPRPADAITVFRIQNPAGDRVVTVPLHDLTADLAQPAVYSLGGSFYGAGNALDPTTGNLTMFYARTPRALTALDGDPAGTTDPIIIPEWDEIHILALYAHMIGKDATNHPPGELDRQVALREREMENFRAYVAAADTSGVSRMGN